MSAEFTPGPWFAGRLVMADDDDDFGTVSVGPYSLDDRPNKDAHYEDTICEVWQNPNLAEDAIDNAQIIAAAPTMFDLLVHLHDALVLTAEYRPNTTVYDLTQANEFRLVSEFLRIASCDTQPKAGDVEQAPLVSGAVTNEVRQTPKV